jgi:hypothetical protein
MSYLFATGFNRLQWVSIGFNKFPSFLGDFHCTVGCGTAAGTKIVPEEYLSGVYKLMSHDATD